MSSDDRVSQMESVQKEGLELFSERTSVFMIHPFLNKVVF